MPRLFATACLLLLLASSAVTQAAEPAASVPCEGAATGFGAGELACPLEANGGIQRLLFTAVFSGVHDDSTAGLRASVDGQTMPCAENSVPQISGEASGDALVCRVVLEARAAGTRRLLKLNLVWHHADPVSFDLKHD